MARRDKGKPSGGNKSEGTGMPSSFTPQDINDDRKQTRKYTNESDEKIGRVRMRHPNRNPDKNNPTNAGGYKS